MKTILKSAIFEDKIRVKNFNKDFVIDEILEKHVEIDSKNIKGIIREIQLNGICLTIRDVKTKNYEIEVIHDFPLFKLHFEIYGYNRYTPSNGSNFSIFIPGGHYNLFYLPEVKGTLSFKTNYRKTLEIIFTEKYIAKIIGVDYKNILKNFGNAITLRKPCALWQTSKPITTELLNTIQEITTCKYEGELKKAYLEAKLNQLLVVLLAKTNDENYENYNVKIGLSNTQIILEVENYIKNNLKKSLTIPQLAVIAGVNTSKLKQDFKTVFNTTIFKHITTLRMEKSKILIKKNNLTISQASYEVGYKNPQHFTVAFKKKYGYLPSTLNKND